MPANLPAENIVDRRRRAGPAPDGAVVPLLALLVACLGGACAAGGSGKVISPPGVSYQGALPRATNQHRAYARELRAHVEVLAGRIGERNLSHPRAMAAATDYLFNELLRNGQVVRQTYAVGERTADNLELTLPGGGARASEVVVIGAHHDSAQGSPGGNDNGSGVAAALVLARALATGARARTLRVVLFANEEPPYFQTDHMGSVVYARACRRRGDRIVAMVSLETLGYFSDVSGSQHYPPVVGALYPDRGNFVAFIANPDSRPLLLDLLGRFRRHARFPSEGAALSASIPGIGWSDHWAFWQQGYPAVMVTDTAIFRDPHYHTSADLPASLDYERLARVVAGLELVFRELANPHG